jgi:hypothetical protein
MTCWLLNSAVLPAGAYGTYRYAPASWQALGEALAGAHVVVDAAGCACGRPHVVSRVGYAETASLIHRLTGVEVPLSRDVSALEPGDRALVVRLRFRVADPRTKGAVGAEQSRDAWEVAWLTRDA